MALLSLFLLHDGPGHAASPDGNTLLEAPKIAAMLSFNFSRSFTANANIAGDRHRVMLSGAKLRLGIRLSEDIEECYMSLQKIISCFITVWLRVCSFFIIWA